MWLPVQAIIGVPQEGEEELLQITACNNLQAVKEKVRTVINYSCNNLQGC